MFRRRKRSSLLLVFLVLLSLVLLRLQYKFHHQIRPLHLSIFEQIHRLDNFLARPERCFTQNEKKNVKRAILVHFPADRSSTYISEFKWLYLSWIETIKNQPTDWHTDLLVYSMPSPFLDELGCILRKSSKKNSCYRIDYRSMWNRTTDDELFASIQMHVPGWCRHLDSLGILLENPDELSRSYDYILRTDMDVFLMPHFAQYIPFNCSFQIGLGGYNLEFTQNKLSRIAQTLDLINVNLSHVGSTWYGPPAQLVLVARLALWICVWLAKHEFTMVQRREELAILTWPQWYLGVSSIDLLFLVSRPSSDQVASMYAGHLAINHYAGRGQIILIQKPYLIDFSCTTNVSLNSVEVIHIHAWHTGEIFSKFRFKRGAYDQMMKERTVWNTSYSLDYILHIAWQSKQMTTKQLYELRYH